MQTGSFPCLSTHGFHRTAYTAWQGEADQTPLVCVHGLTRNGRDFDPLALFLSPSRPVICPDIVGRGLSERLSNPEGYAIGQYCQDMASLFAHLNLAQVDWLGTSMGGLIGMSLAAVPNSPIQRLILNDIGPFIPKEALQDISEYLTQSPLFCSDIEANLYLRTIHSGFGALNDAQWDHLTIHSINQNSRDENGCFRLHYDPAISQGQDIDLSVLWDQIECPILVIRGEDSPLLTEGTYEKMLTKPKTQGIVVPNAGHAPALMDLETQGKIRDWLEDT